MPTPTTGIPTPSLPTLIDSALATNNNAVAADPNSPYDVALGGIPFVYSNNTQNPNIRETAPFEKQRVDQEDTPGEQTLTGWWIRSQDSFHGGAGQLHLEPAVQSPTDHIRYELSKNCDTLTVPGRVTRLPDTVLKVPDATATNVCTVIYSGTHEGVVYLTGTTVKMLKDDDTTITFTCPDPVLNIATDGVSVYAASTTHIFLLNPAAIGSPTTLATFPSASTDSVVALGWVKNRLMAACNGSVYELDVTTSAVTLGASQLKYKHPTVGFKWRCFSQSPYAILAAGDAGGLSIIQQFVVQTVASVATLVVDGVIGQFPQGETVTAILNAAGSVLAIGTNRGIRVGTFDSLYGRLTYGPLLLGPDQPTIPVTALVGRDRFVYCAGLDYNESGFIRVDTGTPTDQAGRYAWAPDLITPTVQSTPVSAAAITPLTNRVVFTVPGLGVYAEVPGTSAGRESWFRTSRIRFGTTEPKLFKVGKVKGTFSSGTLLVTGITPLETRHLVTAGSTNSDPDEFGLNSGAVEWMQLLFTLAGPVQLTSYQAKALPGTRRAKIITLVLNLSNNETTKTGQRVRDSSGARATRDALEELDAAGDEIIFQEFTPTGITSTRVVIDNYRFVQTARPTRREAVGGDAVVRLRTVS